MSVTDQIVPNCESLLRRSSSGSECNHNVDSTSPQHVVGFSVDTDQVDVNNKPNHGRFLTAKYPKHQMGLIRRRLAVEDWMEEELKKLFDVSDEAFETYDTILDLDEILNLDTDIERTAYVQERISNAPKCESVRQKFVTELLEMAATL